MKTNNIMKRALCAYFFFIILFNLDYIKSICIICLEMTIGQAICMGYAFAYYATHMYCNSIASINQLKCGAHNEHNDLNRNKRINIV